MEQQKKPKKTTPQARSLEWLRENNFWCQTTEQTIRYPDKENPGKWKMFRRDLFNFCDILAIAKAGSLHTLGSGGSGSVYLQVTAGMNNKGERIKKIESCPEVISILRAGNVVELHIWRKMGKRGVKIKKWKLARFRPSLDEFNDFTWHEVIDSNDDFDKTETPNLFGDGGSGSLVA